MCLGIYQQVPIFKSSQWLLSLLFSVLISRDVSLALDFRLSCQWQEDSWKEQGLGHWVNLPPLSVLVCWLVLAFLFDNAYCKACMIITGNGYRNQHSPCMHPCVCVLTLIKQCCLMKGECLQWSSWYTSEFTCSRAWIPSLKSIKQALPVSHSLHETRWNDLHTLGFLDKLFT